MFGKRIVVGMIELEEVETYFDGAIGKVIKTSTGWGKIGEGMSVLIA